MPSSHAPIKKYNYERSLFRWVMSRHPEPFEKHGITTRTLERAPLAREAFYTSDWPGARALVQSNDESKYERTAFFDAIIERGLRNGTRFSIDHVTTEEKTRLGITMDRTSGKYYLAAYGSPKARRTSSRRGSQTSSDGEAPELPHMVIKEVEDMITSEIEAAGENPEVTLKKSVDQSSIRGSSVLHFSVSIRRRAPVANGGVDAGREEGEGAGAGPPLTPTADAGAGDTTTITGGVSAGANPGANAAGTLSARRQGSTSSTLNGGPGRHAKEGSSPRQSNSRETAPLAPGPAKSRGRPPSTLASQGGSDFPSESSPPKKRKSITHTVFENSPRLGGTANEQVPSGLSSAGETSVKFGRVVDGTARSQEQDVKPIARQQSSAPLPAMYPTVSTSSSTQFGTASTRPRELTPNGFSSWGGSFPPRNGLRTNPNGHMASQTGTSGGTNGSVLPGPPLQSWHVPHSSQMTRSDELGQVGGGGRSCGGRTSESSSSEGGVSTSLVSGSITTSSQHHLPSMPFGPRPTTTTVTPEQHVPGIMGLNMYSSHARQPHLMSMGSNLHGGTSTWISSNRISGPLGNGNREAVDEEDIDFLASFF